MYTFYGYSDNFRFCLLVSSPGASLVNCTKVQEDYISLRIVDSRVILALTPVC